MIEVFKWYRGYNKGDIGKALGVNNQKNGFKQEKFRFARGTGRNRFSNRVVDEWNKFNNHIVKAQTLGSFKRRLDKFIGEDDRWK